MKKLVFIFIIILQTTLCVFAQLNDRFYASGNPQSASSVGAYTTNVHVGWRQVQQYPASSYNWSSVDTRIQANQITGLRTIVTLRCTPTVSADDSIPGTCAYEYSHGNTSVDSKSSWFPRDTAQWKNFFTAPQPASFVLMQNYPNPFTSSTTIELPLILGEGRGEVLSWQGKFTLKVFDLFGREVLDLSDKIIDYDKLTIDNSQLPAPGMYFYQLRSGKNIQRRKMLLVR